MIDVSIRKMGRKELKEVMEIEHEVLYQELEKSQIRQWVEGEGIFAPQSFVMLIDKRIIGFTVFEIYEIKRVDGVNEIIISLDAMAISEDFQKKGNGKKLLKESIERAKDYWNNRGFKVKGLIIETGTDEAGGFYEKVFSSFKKKVFEKTWSDGKGIIIYFVSLS